MHVEHHVRQPIRNACRMSHVACCMLHVERQARPPTRNGFCMLHVGRGMLHVAFCVLHRADRKLYFAMCNGAFDTCVPGKSRMHTTIRSPNWYLLVACCVAFRVVWHTLVQESSPDSSVCRPPCASAGHVGACSTCSTNQLEHNLPPQLPAS